MKKQSLIIIAGLLLLTSSLFAQEKNHPLIGQLDGAELWVQNTNNIQEYTVITGPIKDDNLTSSIKVIGKATMTAYRYRGDNSAFGIIHNYTEFLEDKGFEILYSCKSGECGGNLSKHYLPLNNLETSDNSVGPAFWDAGYFRNYLSAKKQGKDKTVYVCIFIAQGWWNFPVYRIDVVESKPKKTKMLTAENIAKSILNNGSISIYGIQFDTGKSLIKPESSETIKTIADYIKTNSDKKFYLVGHTDNTGDFSANKRLSEERAKSVMNELTTKYNVNAEQLGAYGVSSLAPVASNMTGEGKRKNRRVEIVEQ